MTKPWLCGLAACLATAPALAQVVVDGSDGRVPPALVSALRKQLEEALIAPATAQLSDLSASGDLICGRINLQKKNGEYAGFTVFVAQPARKRFKTVQAPPPRPGDPKPAAAPKCEL